MPQIVLNGEQFRRLVAGKVVSVAGCEIRLGDVGFNLLEVNPIKNGKATPRKRPHLIKRPV